MMIKQYTKASEQNLRFDLTQILDVLGTLGALKLGYGIVKGVAKNALRLYRRWFPKKPPVVEIGPKLVILKGLTIGAKVIISSPEFKPRVLSRPL